MCVHARFAVQEMTAHEYGQDIVDVTLFAAYDDTGNDDWSKWTPSGSITLTVTNPSAVEYFARHLGRVITVTFDEAPEPPTD